MMPQTSTEEYVSKTYQSPVAVKRWLHQKRFTDALRLLELRPGQTVLDYGTGDGHFLEVAAQQHDAALLFGYEPAEELFVQAKKKLNQTGVTVASELGKLGRKQFDKIVGMEVCEHLPERELGQLLATVLDYLAPGGTFLVSVPIESGLPAMAKNAFRYLKYRNQGYDRLTWSIYLRTILGRPISRSDEGLSGLRYMHSHIGFDFREFERRIAGRFVIRKRYCSPANFLGSGLNNTVYYVCTAG